MGQSGRILPIQTHEFEPSAWVCLTHASVVGYPGSGELLQSRVSPWAQCMGNYIWPLQFRLNSLYYISMSLLNVLLLQGESSFTASAWRQPGFFMLYLLSRDAWVLCVNIRMIIRAYNTRTVICLMDTSDAYVNSPEFSFHH